MKSAAGFLMPLPLSVLGRTGVEMAPNYRRAEQEARDLLRRFGIERPPVDPESVAEALGVPVVYAHFGPGTVDQISGFIQFDPLTIVVNEAIPPRRKTFTIAHELGHYLLHDQYAKSGQYRVMPRNNDYPGGKPDEEKEADAFAAHLLVPMPMFRKYKDYASPSELATMFAVSDDVVLNRLKWV